MPCKYLITVGDKSYFPAMLIYNFGIQFFGLRLSNLFALAESGGYAVLIFPLLIFIKKNSGHNILWSAFFHVLRYLDISQSKKMNLGALLITEKIDFQNFTIACHYMELLIISDSKTISTPFSHSLSVLRRVFKNLNEFPFLTYLKFIGLMKSSLFSNIIMRLPSYNPISFECLIDLSQ